ncbi:MAG: hypothetical protein WBA97_34930 [Actinophytocola sp.]|uniref:hypothetical protein n=1 Tax=Actinophytocola sp. TaxID=1872138 RepID=UPI003C72CE19
MSGVVNERIQAVRSQVLSVVGQVGGELLNLDIRAHDGIVCTELDRDAARALRDALTAFLTPVVPVVDDDLTEQVRAELRAKGRPHAAGMLRNLRDDLTAGQCIAFVKQLADAVKAGVR